MSVFDEFRALAGELFDAFEVPPVPVTRRTLISTAEEVAKGYKTYSTETHSVRAVLTTVKKRDEKGVEYTVTSASVDGDIAIGDEINIGARTFRVTAVDTVQPVGDEAIIRTATLE